MRKLVGFIVLIVLGCISLSASAQGKWSVIRAKDEMKGTSKVRACVESSNSVKQGFPYGRGSTTARLCIYKTEEGVESSLQINQGQLMCDLSRGTFMLKIDEEGAEDLSCVGTSSHNSEMGYFSDGDKAVGAIILSKKIIRIETTLYNYGNVVFRFAAPGKSLPKEFEP